MVYTASAPLIVAGIGQAIGVGTTAEVYPLYDPSGRKIDGILGKHFEPGLESAIEETEARINQFRAVGIPCPEIVQANQDSGMLLVSDLRANFLKTIFKIS